MEIEKFKKYLKYENGCFYWIKSKGPSCRGNIAGTLINGYICIKFDGVYYYAHKLVYFYHTGVYGPIIDHIDNNPSNNLFENLRIATKSQNNHNSKIRKDNKSGFKGVYYKKKQNRFIADISVNSKRYYLGAYETAIEANIIVENFRKKLVGGFARNR